MKLIVPFHDLRTETAPGYEGTFGLLAPLYPEKDWDTDYRKLAQLHKKATQQRLDSVPPLLARSVRQYLFRRAPMPGLLPWPQGFVCHGVKGHCCHDV